jgi:pimeloyl-ACP methyl ester carboxylesterase
MPDVNLVLLPGLLCDERLWLEQVEGLRDLAAVHVGDLTQGETMTEFAAAVLRLAPPGPFALAGLSMGGYTSLEIVRQAPERILGLALLDTTARPETPETSASRRALMARAADDLAGVVAELLPKFVHPARLADQALTAAVTAMAQRIGAAAFVRQERAIMSRIDSRPSLGAIACPTLVLCGREDVLTPPAAHEEMAAAIPGAALHVVPECGHLSTMERPVAVTRAMRHWLERIAR